MSSVSKSLFNLNKFLTLNISDINPNKTGLFEDIFFWGGGGPN